MVFRSPWPDIEVPPISLCEAVLGRASERGDKPAVIEGETGRTLTYRDLVEGARHVAAGLARAGLQPGQPLAIVLPNCIEFALTWYGTLLAGGWVVPISPLCTAAEMEHFIRDSGARFLVTTPECAGAMGNKPENLFITGGNWNELLECRDRPPDVQIQPEHLAVLPYSSGTTGKPKGVKLTHRNIVANIRQAAMDWPRDDDVIVSMWPLYHAAGLNCVLNGFLAAGATVVLMRRFDLESYLRLCERYRATILCGAPPVILAITKSPLWDRFRLQQARYAVSGAAPLGAEMQEAFEQRTGVLLGQGWGMTESTAVITLTPNDRRRRKFGSCGHLVPLCEAQVVDVLSQQPLGACQTGELWIRGPQVTKGYFNQPAANAEMFLDGGWMRTGDIGYIDSDGCVFIVDRLKELIKYNALQVAPAELEDLLQSHPDVQDAAVIGAPDETAGEIPMAFIVKKQGAAVTAGELMNYVAVRVALHKKIRALEFIEQIPKSPTGKILRRVLKERLVRVL